MKRILLAAVLLSGLVLAQTQPCASRLLEEGQRELNLMQTSSYQHKTEVDEPSGQFDYDCSGFLDYALKKVARAAYAELPISRPSAKRPLAQDFYSFFSSLTFSSLTVKTAHWEPIYKATGLKPGDLVSWLRPLESDSYQVALKKFHLFKAEWSEKTRIPGCCNGFPSWCFFRDGK